MALTSLHIWLLGIFFIATCLVAAAVAFTPASSRHRDVVAILILGMYFIFYRDTQLLKIEALRIAVNTFSVIQVGNLLDLLCITRIAFPSTVTASSAGKKDSGVADGQSIKANAGIAKRFLWGISVLWNFRNVGSSEQPSKLPAFRRGDNEYVPSRLVFLVRRSFSLVVRIAILRAWGGGWPFLSPLSDMAFPKQYFFSRMWDVSASEFLVRCWATFLFWTRGYLNHSVAYDILSIIMVASMISPPRNWPPMYGSIIDACSVRAWWG